MNALAASATSSESIALTAPSTVGAYYYGACADAVAGESDTSNNCSAAAAVTVREPPAQPDLEATASLSVSAVAPAGAFELFAAVRNRGGAEAQATTLRYYRSTDAAITIADTEVGTDAVDALAASGSSAESIALTAPSTSGTYYLWCLRGRGARRVRCGEQLFHGGRSRRGRGTGPGRIGVEFGCGT